MCYERLLAKPVFVSYFRIDQEAPVFDCPVTPFTYQLPPGKTTVTVTWEDPSVMDSSGDEVEALIQSAQIGKGHDAAAGTYTVVYMARANAGNVANCEVVIVITVKIVYCVK